MTGAVRIEIGQIGVHLSMTKALAETLATQCERSKDADLLMLARQIRARLSVWHGAETGNRTEELKRHKTEMDLIADAPTQSSMFEQPKPPTPSRSRRKPT